MTKITEADLDQEAHEMFRQIVAAELDNWVPNASQRLLYRSGGIVGINQPDPSKGRPDCGPEREQHCLISDWVAGLFLMRCSSCFRLYEV